MAPGQNNFPWGTWMNGLVLDIMLRAWRKSTGEAITELFKPGGHSSGSDRATATPRETLRLIAKPRILDIWAIDEDDFANDTCNRTVAPGSVPPALPPSVEAAYKLKCIALKKRIAELDEYNDATRQRVIRNNRAIRKMRLERAFLLKCVGEVIEKKGLNINGLVDPDSEGSSEGPPTVSLQTLS
ncbi:MAG: hypothetical protein Q9225_001806 [Loekoesia sp. 1 TL-2023]